MIDNKDLNLNDSLLPKDSVLANVGSTREGYVSPYDWSANHDRNTVTNTFLKDFNFSKGTGGTLVLGGTTNGNGLMQVKNASGTVIIQADNLGHHYYGTSGTAEQIRIDATGFHAYRGTAGGGTESYRIDKDNGFQITGPAGNIIQAMDTTFGTIFGYMALNIPIGAFDVVAGSAAGMDLGLSATRDVIIVGSSNVNITSNDLDVNITAAGDNINLSAGTVDISGTLKVNGATKTAIMPTSQGFKALYCIESPEVWFMDFVEDKDKLDPLFLEVTVPPYKFIKLEDTSYQVWGKRKDTEHLRFNRMTEDQYKANYRFWSKAHEIDSIDQR